MGNSCESHYFSKEELEQLDAGMQQPPPHPAEVWYPLTHHVETNRKLQHIALPLVPMRKTFPELETEYAQEDLFFHTVKEIVMDRLNSYDITRVERRLLGSDIVTLFYLFAHGGIEEISKNRPDVPKADLAYEYLTQVRKKNKEENPSDMNSSLTFGMEVEYTNEFRRITEAYTALLLAFGAEIKTAVSSLDVDTYELPENASKELQERLLTLKAIKHCFGIKVKNLLPQSGLSIGYRSGALAEFINNYVYLTAYYEKKEGSMDHELVMYPSGTYKMQLRELLFLARTGAISGDWNIHTTLGDIELNKRHTEMMDVLLISAAAGYLPSNVTDKLIDETLDFTSHGIMFEDISATENQPKTSVMDDDTEVYFPFHKRREGRELSPYPDLRSHPKTAVETRGILNYPPGDFPLLVRHVSFTRIAAEAIQAVQRPKKQRTDKDKQLIEKWNHLKNSFHQLLRNHELSPLSSRQYYTKDEDQLTTYGSLLYSIIGESIFNDSFRTEARKIIREFKKEVVKTLTHEA